MKIHANVELLHRGNEAEFSVAFPPADCSSANIAGKNHGAFAWEEPNCLPSSNPTDYKSSD